MSLHGTPALANRNGATSSYAGDGAAMLAGAVGARVLAYGAPSIAVAVYALYWLLYLHAPSVYQAVLTQLGSFGPHPFYDLDSVLTSIDCARQGVDVTVRNGCMGGGVFQYSPLLLGAARLPIGQAQTVPLGLGQGLLFLASLFALPCPRRWLEFWILLLAALSSNVLVAIESGNIDVPLYLLVFGGVHLLLLGPRARLAGYATLLGAAAIKFYPACLLVLAVRERPGRFVAIALGCLVAALPLVAAFPHELGHILPTLPQGTPGVIFSASSLPLGLAFITNGGDADHGIGLAVRIGATAVLIGVCVAMTWRQVPAIRPGFRALPDRQSLLLVTGAVAMTFCFFAARNYFYREVFLILTLPALWELGGNAPDRAGGRRFRLASWVVVGLLWSAFFQMGTLRLVTEPLVGMRVVQAVWLVRELCCWWLISLLLGVVVCFLRDAPVLAAWRRCAAA